MLVNLSTHRSAPPEDLVDLLEACHQRIRRFIALAHRAAVHQDAPHPHVIEACIDVERYFSEALPLHVADEEESIEPRLRGLSPQVDQALDTMAHQHEDHARKLTALLRATAGVRENPGDQDARAQLAAAAEDLERDFLEHLEQEERVILPAIRHHLTPETQTQIIKELRHRRRQDAPKTQEQSP